MDRKKYALPTALIVIALISFFILRPVFSNPNGFYKRYITETDEKIGTVMMLSASTAATLAIITALPDDWATPVANQMAEIAKTFLLILTVLYAEKYLMPLLGCLSTGLIIPVACILWVYFLWSKKNKALCVLCKKALILAMTSALIIPLGLDVSNSIERTFESSIQITLDESLNSEQDFTEIEDQDRNFFQRIGDSIGDFFSDIVDGTTELYENAKNAISHAVEAFAIMLVVNCIIPILVLVAYIFIIKRLFKLDFSISNGKDRVLSAIRSKPKRLKDHK